MLIVHLLQSFFKLTFLFVVGCEAKVPTRDFGHKKTMNLRQRYDNQNHSNNRSLLTTRLIRNFMNKSLTDFGSNGRKPGAPWLDRDPVFVGRETELQILQHTFKRIVSSQKSETVILHGPSGVGKTAFVNSFMKTLTSSVLFASGKFNQLKSQAPHATLVTACESLCRQIMKQENYDEIRDRMRSVLGSEISRLATLIPELAKLNISTSIEDNMLSQNIVSFQRFKQLFRSFLRCVASAVNPIVLFLDDIQWADATSTEVLDFLIQDVLSRNILILISYRDGELASEYLEKLNSPSQRSQFADLSLTHEIELSVLQNTDIFLEKLDKVDFIIMISLILQVERFVVESLGALIWSKTDGNPFYALTFLEMLYSSGMLTQLSDGRWVWDENQIWLQTDVTENLAKMLESKLQRLPDQLRSILQIASFIGHEFSIDVLTTILYEEQDMIEGTYTFDRHSKEVIRGCIDDALIIASKEGLVEKIADSIMYKFAHDSIAQVLYEDFMPDVCERQLLHRRIGYLLRESLRGDCKDQVNKDLIIFLATNNLNHALKAIDSSEDMYDIAELNLMAGKLAMEKSNFLQAAEYLGVAVNLVQSDDSWTSHYDFCIDLFSVAAEVEKVTAHYERSNDFVMKILARAKNQQHCYVAYKIQIGCLAAKGGFKASISLGLEVLQRLDMKIPKQFTIATIAKEFLFTRTALGRKKVSCLLNLPELTDEDIINTFLFMDTVLVSAFLLGDEYKEMFAYFSLRMLRLTIKHGLSPIYTPLAILSWGTIAAGNGDLRTAIECEKVAFAIIERYQSDSIRGRAMIGTFGTIHFWKNKLDDDACQQILFAYHLAMSFGDIFFAKFGILEWIAARTYLDHSLEETNQLMRIFVGDLREDGAKQALILILPKWQFVST
jgi:predicted ATPase